MVGKVCLTALEYLGAPVLESIASTGASKPKTLRKPRAASTKMPTQSPDLSATPFMGLNWVL